MFLQQVEVTAAPGRAAAFEAALLEVRQRVFMSPGFRGLTVAQSVENPSTYLVQVRWESAGELAEHAGSDRMERCWGPAMPFLAGPPRIEHYEERPNLDAQGPGVVTDLSWTTG